MPDRLHRIFLLSHMRAYTSLAGHILGSNPAINGYYEMHLSYDDAAALERQWAEYAQHETLKENSRYLFDKLLHNDYRLATEHFGAASLKVLVALREPEPTIKSIVDLFSRKEQNSSYASPDEATRYYIDRLEWLAGFCRDSARDYYYFDSQLFQSAPQRLLSALSTWLELDIPLSDRYQTFSQTGKARKGDSSKYIHSGKIGNDSSGYPNVHIPQPFLKEAQSVYLKCRQEMIDHAADAVVI